MPDLLDRLKTALADRYAIEREIGAGGMATVYLAEDLKHERKVALKVLRPEIVAALGAERFLREIKIAASLTHPHILPLHDSGEVGGFLYYVMPYVEGESLRDRIHREKQLSIEDSIKIASEVADALNSAHKHDVIHRDIKPENILLEEGHAVVADFGIARAIHAAGGEQLTETGLAVGTPAYMSPEQAMGSKELDGRSDLYSLGCVLYEMLAGEPPFTGRTAQTITARKLSEPVPGLRTVRETVPATIEQVTMQVLAKVPADRFATAWQFAEALAAATLVPVTEPRPQRPHRRLSPGQRRAVLRAGALLGMIVLVLGAWATWGPEGSGGRATPVDLPASAPPEVEARPFPFPKIVVIPVVVDSSANMAVLSEKIADRLEALVDSLLKGQLDSLAVGPQAVAAVSMVRPMAPVPPVERIQRLTGAVGDLFQTGTLNRGRRNGLISKLNAAARQLGQDNLPKAATQLQAFSDQVEAYVTAGILGAAQGQALIDGAQDAINQLSG